MSKTSIEWTDVTWNPIRGTIGRWHCTHVSEGCRNCYAERINKRWGGPDYKPGADTFRLDEKILEQPLHWKQPRKVFVCDMTDLFHEEIAEGFILRMLFTMAVCRRHTFQVLTKRPERMLAFLTSTKTFTVLAEALAEFTSALASKLSLHHINDGLSGLIVPNIWLGVSVEDQKTADERIPFLLQTPAAVRFVSYEPALGPVDFTRFMRPHQFEIIGKKPAAVIRKMQEALRSFAGLDWVIIGGESGPQARPFDLGWARSVIVQCQAAKVPLFVKQLGAHPMDVPPPPPGKHYAPGERPGQSWRLLLHHKKGGDINEWPKDLRIREWPR